MNENIENAINPETSINEDNQNIIFKCEFKEEPVNQYKYAEIYYGRIISIHNHFMPLDKFKRLFRTDREEDFIDILPAELASGFEAHVGDYIFYDDSGTLKIKRPVYPDTVSGAKLQKLDELKSNRDSEEINIITVNGYDFDYDDKARERINAAIIALDVLDATSGTVNTIEWTLADNSSVEVNANFLRLVVAKIAERSSELHVKYRNLKNQIIDIENNTELSDAEKITQINNINW